MDYLKESEWADMAVAIDGKSITGIRNISYKEADEDDFLHAAGRKPIGIQTGNTMFEGSVKLLKNELDALNTAAKLLGYGSIKDVPNLVLTAAYKPKGGRVLKTDTMTGCKISELPYGWEQGGKFMEIECPFKFLDIKRA